MGITLYLSGAKFSVYPAKGDAGRKLCHLGNAHRKVTTYLLLVPQSSQFPDGFQFLAGCTLLPPLLLFPSPIYPYVTPIKQIQKIPDIKRFQNGCGRQP